MNASNFAHAVLVRRRVMQRQAHHLPVSAQEFHVWRTRPLGFAEERQNDRDLATRHRLVAPEFADGKPIAAKRQTVLEDRKHHVPVFLECEVLVGPEGFRS